MADEPTTTGADDPVEDPVGGHDEVGGRDVDDPATTALVDALRAGELAVADPAHDGPHVTIAVATRDGLHHLQGLFTGLAERTAYRSFDVVVVDNASTDGTRRWLADTDFDFDVHVVANDDNASFSRANNQALEVATGELFLALNNDVDPVRGDWLTHLVTALDDPGVAAAGSLLVYPPRPADRRGQHDDLTVQHAGVAFRITRGRVRAVNRGAGADPRVFVDQAPRPTAALSAACLLVRRDDLRDLGGFDEGYVYGSEDWDLSLRLARRGRLLLVGRSVLFHHEFGTQHVDDDDEVRQRRRANHSHFNRTWGAALRRALLLERLADPDDRDDDSPPLGEDDPPSVLVTPDGDGADALAADFSARGWTVSTEQAQDAVDLAVVQQSSLPGTRPRAAVTAALAHPSGPIDLPDWVDLVVRPETVDWAHESDAVTTLSPAGADLADAGDVLAAIRGQVARPRIAVRACPPNWEKAKVWGDTPFARSFARALRAHGCETSVQVMSDWDQPWANPFDVVVHLRGLSPQPLGPAAVNVMWLISHPELVTDEELDGYDLVLVASSVFADELRSRTATPVEVMWQATDTRTFRPSTRDRPRDAHGIVVVANARWPARPAVQWLRRLGWDFTLFGAHWTMFSYGITADVGFVPNDELTHVYGNADIVVADQWELMAARGFVANRLFDVLASGGFVISDGGPGVEEVFGDLVPTYANHVELDELLCRYVDDPAARSAVVARAMPYVRRNHGFDHRARQLLDLLDIPLPG